jgi:phenylalanyl-tRNA synthetase alpha chain
MIAHILTLPEVRDALSIRDLTNPSEGPHSMQLLVDDVLNALKSQWACEVLLHRQSPIVSVVDNYDRLHYPPDGAARDARYTRYVCEVALLRTQTSAVIPPLLRSVAKTSAEDILLACPGLVYRRDCIDRLHTGEPHQIDLWRIRKGVLTTEDLKQMIDCVVQALLPGRPYRIIEAIHPYTTHGLQIDVLDKKEWVEIGECGLALPALLEESGLTIAAHTGLAMGLGLDRVLMLRKGIDDIRILRSNDPRILAQMLDLESYKPVSSMPSVRRDVSLVLPEETTAEELGDRVRRALKERVSDIESIEVLAETLYPDLPKQAIQRLGIKPGQKNVLLRIVLRALEKTLTNQECNELRDVIYQELHCGAMQEWAASSRR